MHFFDGYCTPWDIRLSDNDALSSVGPTAHAQCHKVKQDLLHGGALHGYMCCPHLEMDVESALSPVPDPGDE